MREGAPGGRPRVEVRDRTMGAGGGNDWTSIENTLSRGHSFGAPLKCSAIRGAARVGKGRQRAAKGHVVTLQSDAITSRSASAAQLRVPADRRPQVSREPATDYFSMWSAT
jgi:hypothetical protein